MVSLDIVTALMEKCIQLRKVLRDRRLAHNGISSDPPLYEIRDNIVSGNINPKDYWKIVEFEVLDEKMKLREEMRYHRRASLTQVVYFGSLYHEHYDLWSERGERAYNKRRMIELTVEMGETLGWGFYHWAFAEDFFGRIAQFESKRAKMGGEAKSSKRNEEKTLLKCLVKSQLEHHPQRKKGWSNMYDTAEIIGKKIEEIAEEQNFPISKKGDDLQHEVIILIDENKDVASIYKNNSRSRGG